MLRIQVDLNGVIEYEDIEQKERATEPGKVPVQEGHGFLKTFRREPIIFVWQVNHLWRQDRDYLWYRESNYCDKDAYEYQDLKERLLRLPAVRMAPAVKMGCDDTGQLRIHSGKMNRGVQCQQDENQLGKSRIQVNLFL